MLDMHYKTISELQREYWTEIREAATEIVARHDDEDDDEAMYEDIMEYADSSRWTFITGQAILTLLFSENENEVFDTTGELNENSVAEMVNRAAFFAFWADLRDRVQTLLEEKEEQNVGESDGEPQTNRD